MKPPLYVHIYVRYGFFRQTPYFIFHKNIDNRVQYWHELTIKFHQNHKLDTLGFLLAQKKNQTNRQYIEYQFFIK